MHEDIRELGLGRFSHWQRKLLFSTRDNTSPLSNGRQYRLLLPDRVEMPLAEQVGLSRSVLFALDERKIAVERGNCYTVPLPPDVPEGDGTSAARLFEDGIELTPANSMHEDIRELGLGRFSHWQRKLLFSSSDNTSPLSNGRQYRLLLPDRVEMPLVEQVGLSRSVRSSLLIRLTSRWYRYGFRPRLICNFRGGCTRPFRSVQDPFRLGTRLFEDGVELGPRSSKS